MKKISSLLLAITLLFSCVFTGANAAGWVSSNGNWYFIDASGELCKNQWMQDNYGWCYLGADGRMVTNRWIKDSLGWCYVGSDGYCVANTWVADSLGWCYVGSDGYMATNQWIADSLGWCYVGKDGYCVTNSWVKDSLGWCYLDSDGYMVANRWIQDTQGWCYVGKDGYCMTNSWVKDSLGWCYLDGNGRMVTNRWVQDAKGWCYIGANGYCVTNTWMKDSTGWCYLDAEGSMVTLDWVQTNGNWYYLDRFGYMLTNCDLHGGCIGADGIWQESHTWVQATCTEAKYCARCTHTEGSALGHKFQNGTCEQCGKVFSIAMSQDLPIQLECSYGQAVATLEFSNMTYTLTENTDGTINLKITFTVSMVDRNSAGGNYVDFWVYLSGQSSRCVGFVGFVGQTKTASLEYHNIALTSNYYTLTISGT